MLIASILIAIILIVIISIASISIAIILIAVILIAVSPRTGVFESADAGSPARGISCERAIL